MGHRRGCHSNGGFRSTCKAAPAKAAGCATHHRLLLGAHNPRSGANGSRYPRFRLISLCIAEPGDAPRLASIGVAYSLSDRKHALDEENWACFRGNECAISPCSLTPPDRSGARNPCGLRFPLEDPMDKEEKHVSLISWRNCSADGIPKRIAIPRRLSMSLNSLTRTTQSMSASATATGRTIRRPWAVLTAVTTSTR